MKQAQTQFFVNTPRRLGGYLSRRDFCKMMGIAVAVHGLFFAALAIFPDPEVTHIPVRALSFKLGDQDRIAAYSDKASPDKPAAPVMKASAPITNARVEMAEIIKPVKAPKVERRVEPKLPKPKPVPHEENLAPLPMPQPALAAQPQQYVREMNQLKPAAGNPDGAMGGIGNETSQTDKTAQEIRDRYEQQISGWIQRHKIYPAEAGGREGRVVVRMRIDRNGVVRYYALEQSCGIPAIDNAALDMVKRANPVPATPVNYPAGNLIEFLIPITFKAPL